MEFLISLVMYVRAVFRHWFLLVVFAIGLAGDVQTVRSSVHIPAWVFVALTIIGFVGAQFHAFHEMRMERDLADAALEELTKLGYAPPKLEFSHEFQTPRLTIDVVSHGSTMYDVLMKLVVPATVTSVQRVDKDGRGGGSVRREKTGIDSEPAICWYEEGIALHGFSTGNRFQFELLSLARDTGTFPFTFKVACDELGGWKEYHQVIEFHPAVPAEREG
jgi:hypothetical protein